MKKNMGGFDRILRIIVALLVVIAFYMDIVSGVFGIVLLAVAAIFVLTSFVSFCPLYKIFGISSCPVKKEKSQE
ncbi:MAG: DUF2892 domain-containing protein [Salinivirgaceae bacterium]|nr:DUF2892 domain-containing protein [Salinivirgaceae bacterium]